MSTGFSLLRSLFEPGDRLLDILRYAQPLIIHPAETELSIGIFLLRSLFEPSNRLFVILWCTSSVL